MTTRREIMQLSALSAASALAATAQATPTNATDKPRPLNMLILGGTGYTGPNQVRYALQRGHKVTLFNRGRRPKEWPSEVEELTGDRDKGDVAALKGRRFDVCIDNPTSVPFWIRDVAALLKGKVQHYIYISSLSAYAKDDVPGADESAVTQVYKGKDRYAETMDTLRADLGLFGPLKAACEAEVRKHYGKMATIIRPGYIVGPEDPYDRLTYWMQRMTRAGADLPLDMLVPGDGKDPIQYIDPRDLAEWTIRLAEQKAFGTFNATGPHFGLDANAFFYGLRSATTSGVKFNWVDHAFVEKNALSAGGDLPIWAPGIGETAGFATRDVSKAKAAGLTFRPLATTAAETLAHYHALPADRKAALRAGLSAEREATLMKAWRDKV